MTQQPEALRLADRLDLYATGDAHQQDIEQAAAELRRLHQSERDGWRYAKEWEARATRLAKALGQAMEALEQIAAYRPLTFAECSDAEAVMGIAENAIPFLRERLAQPEQEAPSPSVDAYNRMLRQQLEAEWVALQEIKRNYRSQPQQEHVIDCPRCGHCCPQTKGES